MARKLEAVTRRIAASLEAATLALFALLAGMDRARARSAAALDEEAGPVAAQVEPADADGAAWDLANLDHERVDHWIARFQTDKRNDHRAWRARMGRKAAALNPIQALRYE